MSEPQIPYSKDLPPGFLESTLKSKIQKIKDLELNKYYCIEKPERNIKKKYFCLNDKEEIETLQMYSCYNLYCTQIITFHDNGAIQINNGMLKALANDDAEEIKFEDYKIEVIERVQELMEITA